MSLALRRINKRQQTLSRVASLWRKQGWAAELDTPSAYGEWLQLGDAGHNWRGWLHLTDWLEHAAPQLAGAAISAGAMSEVAKWLAVCEVPLRFPMPELTYERLWIGGLSTADNLPAEPLLRVMSDKGPVWLEYVSLNTVAETLSVPDCVQWPLSLVVGRSKVESDLLSLVENGDVLLIKESVSEVYCYTKLLGHFCRSGEECILEMNQIQDLQETEETVVHDLGQLPVSLDFILFRKQVTLTELQNMYKRKVLSLPADIENKTEIRANGALIGYGELVQLDNSLGVEVTEWVCGSSNGK
ncbi:TPA: YscQ/HrcQ family type III secretion apparatus protein [Salmonella enterica subsp. enterica serovar Saintpaul str. CFSAN004144]|nr:YscQ/HrcQ family type III secretion apparatus protein [Salmonella enterica subsp. enterica serovar Saintpaul str. CFSAN004144]